MVKTLVMTHIFCPSSDLEKKLSRMFTSVTQVTLVTDLLNVSTDFAVVTLVSENTLEDLTEVSLVIDDTKHSQKKVGTFFGGEIPEKYW